MKEILSSIMPNEIEENNIISEEGQKLPDPPKTIPQNFLSVSQYSKKYGIVISTIYRLAKNGKMIYKMLHRKLYVLDVPPEQHQLTNVDLNSNKNSNINLIAPHPGTSKVNEKRKIMLKERHLPVFLEKVSQDKMTFSTKEVLGLFNLNTKTLRDWRSWGLKSRPIPKGYKQLAEGQMVRGSSYYFRKDLYDFLSGNWVASEWKKNTTDDVFIGAATGSNTPDGQYFQYDPSLCYPINSDGFFSWLKDKKPIVRESGTGKLREFIPNEKQREFFTKTLEVDENGLYKNHIAFACWPRGEGKCHKIDTPILMYDGTIKKSQNIKVGDLLMGDDSTPRKVLSLAKGRGEMYEIVPFKGESFTVNKNHILSLVRRENRKIKHGKPYSNPHHNKITNISVEDYFKKNIYFKTIHYLYRVPIIWNYREVDIDPYFLGLWLGDGTSASPSITTQDKEIISYIETIAKKLGLKVTKRGKKNDKALTCDIVLPFNFGGKIKNPLKVMLEKYNLINNKHIPHEYKINNRDVQLQVLAGIIDSDGYVNRTSYVITLKSKQLADDIVFISRSLGFESHYTKCQKSIKSINFTGSYYRISINGNCSIIPVKLPHKKVPIRKHPKNPLIVGIKKIHYMGIDDYYGFTIDGNGLFVLGNYIVTHNSTSVIILAIFRFFNMRFEKIYVTADSREHAVSITYERMKEIIQDTEALKNTPGLEIKEKDISLYASDKNPICQIKPIPKSVGLYPGLTCVLMTELHKTDDNDKKFITDLWSSTRATRNAMILCDTTVAEPGHIVHEVWEKYQKGEVPKLYYDYYCDRIYNPETTPEYLASMRAIMPEADYNRYFRNRWRDAIGGFFPKHKIKEIEILKFKGNICPSPGLADALEKAEKLKEQKKIYEKGKIDFTNIERQIIDIEKDFTSIDELYKLPATNIDLDKIAKQYGVNFIIGVGLDRASFTGVTPDRTVLTCVARGIISSEISYYFILDVFIPKESTLPVLTDKIHEWSLNYGWLDRIVVETYQAQDFYYWCKEKGYESEIVSATPKIQYPLFMNLYQIINQGYLKSPSKVPYYTDSDGNYFRGFSNTPDIMREEMDVFSYKSGDEAKGAKFYSPQKRLKGGIKDDVMFSLGWAIYATQSDMLVPSNVRGERPPISSLIINTDVVGDYV